MAISILDSIDKQGSLYNNAVIFTFTLNLQFFENVVEPRLRAAGCSNVLILPDAYGYSEALSLNGRGVDGVGRRYVCSPLRTHRQHNQKRGGVQHAKIILLTGRNDGCLLMGSGNLTMSGYGQNLELFTRYTVAYEANSLLRAQPEEVHAFAVVWDLLHNLQTNRELTSAASARIDAIEQSTPWLSQLAQSATGAEQSSESAQAPEHFRLLHSLKTPLISLLPEAPGGPLNRLEIIAPFVDLRTIEELIRKFRPAAVVLGTDPVRHNLDGSELARRCENWGVTLSTRVFDAIDGWRPLHAKMLVGVGTSGAWCLTGSANCTYNALQTTWLGGGTLKPRVGVGHPTRSRSMAYGRIRYFW